MTEQISLDPIHHQVKLWDLPFSQEIWDAKYRYKGGFEPTVEATARRVVQGVYANDKKGFPEALAVTTAGLLLPAGRIWSGAGTDKVVTLMNCYVMPAMPDSMDGISDTLKVSMLTMQQGGGIGVDFSTLRPRKAYLKRTQSEASGPIKFMETWDAMCRTIMSAGSRRGAMMATMADTHPDLPEFIQAKSKHGILTNFNVSVLVSDAFLAAVEDDADWPLYFHEPTFDRKDVYGEFEDEYGQTQYIYSVWKARELWDLITTHTYRYSEPGVIFIDRVNDLNNLSYLETIRCTNPCGEQPLPPNGCCNLGAVNLALCVNNPFTQDANIDFKLIRQATEVGVRFLDNVIDVTKYPTQQQAEEEYSKRRIGLGITGLADMLAQLSLRYGSPAAVATTQEVMCQIANIAYYTSARLAEERGAFPLYNKKHHLHRPFIQQLDPDVQDLIDRNGLRNGMLLTIAPTGTTSVFAGNISSGVEPIFSHFQNRRVLQADDTWKTYENVPGFTARLLAARTGIEPQDLTEESLVAAPTINELKLDDHLATQGAAQKWVDASVSKTINIPEEYPFEDFQEVYQKAYALGCKGCTTYRPSTERGAILTDSKTRAKKVEKEKEVEDKLWERPDVLKGHTYRIRWPNNVHSLYLTINHDSQGIPREVFVQSRDAKHQEWTTALTLMISAILRRGGDIHFVPRVLQGIQSMNDIAWIKGKFYGSLVALIGAILEEHFENLGLSDDPKKEAKEKELLQMVAEVAGEPCPKCGQKAMIFQEGCKVCQSCGHSSCD